MIRWIIFLVVFHQISTRILEEEEEHLSFKRHIGSAREKFFRAKFPLMHHEIVSQRQQQQILPSPDILRSRWMELLYEPAKTFD